MASSKQKNQQSLDELLAQDIPQGPIRRGEGMHLSTETSSSSAQTRKRTSAQTHQNEPKRVNRGYSLREDLVKQCKRIALDEDRKLFEIMDEALERYILWKRSNA